MKSQVLASPRQQFWPASSSLSTSEKEEEEEILKSLFMLFKWDDGPVLYSLYAVNKLSRPVTILELGRDKYPRGLGCVELDSRIYFVGGQFKDGSTIYTSRKVYVLDLTTFKKESAEALLIEGPNMNSGKVSPLVMAAHGKIYVLASSLYHYAHYLNTYILDPLPHLGTDDITQLHCNDMFEVFDPKSNEWTVLPVLCGYLPTYFCGHAVVHDKILLCDLGYCLFSFDIKTQLWEYFDKNDFTFDTIIGYDDALVHAILQSGCCGRGLVVDDDTLYALTGDPKAPLHAYHISNNKEDISFPNGVVTGLQFPFSGKYNYASTGGYVETGADMIHLGDQKFCFVLSASDLESPKRDVRVMTFQIIKDNSEGMRWSANMLDSYVIEDINPSLGSIFYCFARFYSCEAETPFPSCQILFAKASQFQTIEATPKAKDVRGKPILNLEVLRNLFEKDRATGSGVESAKEKVRRWEREERSLNIDELAARNEIHIENYDKYEGTSAPESTSTSSKGTKRKASTSKTINEKFEMITTSIDKIAKALDSANDVLMTCHRRIYTWDEVFAELTRLGVDKKDIFGAAKIIMADPTMADTFFGCPPEMRKDWVLWMMSCHR